MSFHPNVIALGRFGPETTRALRELDLFNGSDPEEGKPFVATVGALEVSHIATDLAEAMGIYPNDPASSFAPAARVLERIADIEEALEGHHDKTLAPAMRRLAELGVSFALVD